MAPFVPTPKIVPRHYQLLIHPNFNESDRPFSYSGRLRLTFTPDVLKLRTIVLDAPASLKISQHNLFVYRSRVLKAEDFEYSTRNEPSVKDTDKQFDANALTTIASDFYTLSSINEAYSAEESNESLTTIIDNEIDPMEAISVENTSDSMEVEMLEKLMSPLLDHSSEDMTEMVVTAVHHDKIHGKFKITVGLDMKFGHFYILQLRFFGNMSLDNGILLTAYKDVTEEREEKYFAGTIGSSKLATSIFPCVNDIRSKATFQLSVSRKRTMRSMATSALLSSEDG